MKWIDAAKRKPQMMMNVLVYCGLGNGKRKGLHLGYWGVSKHWWVGAEYGPRVTHWMPLPKPPKCKAVRK